jgi:predicted secreted Zn-dependent protease
MTGDASKGAGHATGDGGNGRPGGDYTALSQEFLIQWSRQHEQLRTLARFSCVVDALQVRYTKPCPRPPCSPCIQLIFLPTSALSSA